MIRILLILLGLALAFPLINQIEQRQFLTPQGIKAQDPAFIQFSKQLQVSCVDCHTRELVKYPIYVHLPIAKQIIAEDIQSALEDFEITPEQLTGEEAFSPKDLREIRKVLTDDEMPPLKYKIMHWEALIGAKEKKALLDYINAQNPGDDLIALTQNNIPVIDKNKARLGKALYFDKRLSSDNQISCASCHALDKGGTDQESVSTGIKSQRGPINSPTVFNATFNFHQFWDGHAKTLQEQAAGPVNNPKEMGSNWPQVIGKLKQDSIFSKQFKTIYPEGYSAKNITEAIAEYEKTLVTPNSPLDQYLLGDKKALTVQQQRGYQLFKSHRCIDCHFGINLGGQSFEKMGKKRDYFAWRGRPLTEADLGRFNVTKRKSDRHKFKVPMLRNVALTYPYFHNGSTSNLVEAVQIMAEFQTGKKLSEQEAEDIATFLKSTTGKLY